MARKNAENAKFSWKQFLAYVSTVSILVLFVGVLVGLALGVRPLEARAMSLVGGGPTVVKIAWPPVAGDPTASWLPVSDQERLLALAHDTLRVDPNPLSREPLEALVSAMKGTGWFDGTPVASRARGGVINVTGQWRVPAAVVRQQGKDHLVSWEAMPMPAVYNPGESNLRFIEEPGVSPPRTAGGQIDYATRWPGEGLAAALELLETVVKQPWAGQAAGIDASDYARTGQLTIVTTSRNRVVWGGRPSKPLLGEVSTNAKLIHLSQLLHDFKTIDAGYPLIYVNSDKIQFDVSASAKTQAALPGAAQPEVR